MKTKKPLRELRQDEAGSYCYLEKDVAEAVEKVEKDLYDDWENGNIGLNEYQRRIDSILKHFGNFQSPISIDEIKDTPEVSRGNPICPSGSQCQVCKNPMCATYGGKSSYCDICKTQSPLTNPVPRKSDAVSRFDEGVSEVNSIIPKLETSDTQCQESKVAGESTTKRNSRNLDNQNQVCKCGHVKSSHGYTGYSDGSNDLGKGLCRTCEGNEDIDVKCKKFKQKENKTFLGGYAEYKKEMKE